MNINLKKVISSVAALAMSLSCFTAFAADFSDVEATASYKNAIDTLVALEVVNGYEDGTFKPEAEITRAEVTKMVVAAMGPSYTKAAESSVGASEFSDVVNHWAAGYISVGVAQKFINGMGDGTFAPDANVTYAQIVKMLVAALGYTSAAEIAGGYPNGYIQTANQIGVTAGVAGVSADTNVTRAQVAQLIANAVDVPLVVVTNWTTNILTGEPVAETKIMDGEEGRSYKTLLTEYHDTYKVKGRVEATHAQGITKVGEVDFRVENADNYDGYAYKAYTKMEDTDNDPLTPKVQVYYNSAYVSGAKVGDTNAEDLLFTYAEALININDDDEATILTITPYGKNDIFTLAAKDFDAYTSGTPNTLDFFVNESSSKTKTYKLDGAVELYVNGVYVAAGVNAGTMATYATANKIGTVTLIDSPATGETSKDGDIDYVMIDMQKWAVVDTTVQTTDNLIIYLKDFEPSAVGASIKIDTTDEDLVYEFTKNGEVVDFDEIKSDDVLLVKYDVIGNLASANASNFLSIDICDKVVEGQVVGSKTVDGNKVYTINGEEYKYWTGADVLDMTTEYKLMVDSFDRIIKYEELASSANYAVIDRVYKDNNTDEYKIRLIKADGTRETFVAKSIDIAAAAGNVAYSAGTSISGTYDLNGDGTAESITGYINGSLKTLINRAVKYKVNSSKEINSIAPLALTSVTDDYTESSTRVQSARMDEATQILDLTDVCAGDEDDATTYAADDIAAGSLSSFVDGEQYTVLYGDKNTASGTFRFVIITDGNADITALTSFAVIDSVSAGSNADGSVTVLNVYTADKQGLVSYEVDEDVVLPALTEGDVVVMYVDNGIVKSFAGKIFSQSAVVEYDPTANAGAGNWAATMWAKTMAWDPADTDGTQDTASDYFLATGISKWEDTTLTSNNWARAGYGIVIDKVGSTLTIARKAVAAGTEATGVTSGDVISAGTDIEEFNVSNDVNVFVYDYNAKLGKRVSKGAYGNVVRTVVPEAAIFTAADGSDVYDWTVAYGINALNEYAVYYKVTNDEITDIFVIAPAI